MGQGFNYQGHSFSLSSRPRCNKIRGPGLLVSLLSLFLTSFSSHRNADTTESWQRERERERFSSRDGPFNTRYSFAHRRRSLSFCPASFFPVFQRLSPFAHSRALFALVSPRQKAKTRPGWNGGMRQEKTALSYSLSWSSLHGATTMEW